MKINGILILVTIIIFVILSAISIFLLISYFAKAKKNREWYGFTCFDIDIENKRIRINNDIKLLNYFPPNIKSNVISTGTWFSMSEFSNIFNSETNKLLNDFYKSNTKPDFTFDLSLTQEHSNTNYRFLIERKEDQGIIGTLFWNDYSSKQEFAFANIFHSEDIPTLFQNKESSIIYLNIKNKYSFKEKYIINEIKNLIPPKLVGITNLWIKRNKFYISVNDNQSVKISKINKYIMNLFDKLQILKKYFNASYILETELFNSIDKHRLNLLTNYLIVKYLNDLQPSKIGLNILLSPEYVKFCADYNEAMTLINSGKYSIKHYDILDVKHNKNVNKVIFPVFEDPKKEEFYKKDYNNLDIFEYMFLSFLMKAERFDLNNSILIIDDYVMNLLNINYLKKIHNQFKNISFLMKINNDTNFKYLENTINVLINSNIKIGFQINKISSYLIDFINRIKINFLYIQNDTASTFTNNIKTTLNASLISGYDFTAPLKIIFENIDLEILRSINLKNNNNLYLAKNKDLI